MAYGNRLQCHNQTDSLTLAENIILMQRYQFLNYIVNFTLIDEILAGEVLILLLGLCFIIDVHLDACENVAPKI